MLGFNNHGSSNINQYLRYGLWAYGALELGSGVLHLAGNGMVLPSVGDVPVIGPPIVQLETAIKTPLVATLGSGGTDVALGMAVLWGSGYWKMP